MVTHRHQDHAGLADAVSSSLDAPVVAWGGFARGGSARLDGEDREPGFVPDVPLADGDVVEGPGFSLTALHTPGHTSDHMCFVDSVNRRVFCGDHIMAWSTTVILPPDGHVGGYLDSLERLKKYHDHVFWPTHGPPIAEPARYIDQLIAHRAERERQLVEALSDGPADADTLVSRVYHDIDPRLKGAARQSLIAGLEWLIEKGEAIRSSAEPCYRLRQASSSARSYSTR
ncbi:MAG: MBL fold metallo-hydrolase [Proteobacteria bacterium]|nr:MAG: MBL fold metallo-hydrolase [Pseudomonadota bacterium]